VRRGAPAPGQPAWTLTEAARIGYTSLAWPRHDSIGLEARVADADHQSLKLWLRLLACSTQIEIEIRRRLRERFGVTLPRFDYLAQLHRHPDGLRMSVLSRYLMVSGGNVTGLTDELEGRAGRARDQDPADGRSCVRLTTPGRAPSSAWRANTKPGWSSSSAASTPATSARSTKDWAGCACSWPANRGEPMPPEETVMSTPACWPATAARAGRLPRRHFLWQVQGGVGHHHAEPARAQEPADLRVLRRAARPVRPAAPRRRRARGGGHRRRRQLLLRRRRARDHRPAAAPEHAPELLMFTRMTGDLVKAMRACPQPIVAAIDGVCAGAGAIIAMASDLRLGTARSKTAFLFNRVGLAGCDMGACAMLPRIIGQGRASELLYTGRACPATKRWPGASSTACAAPDALLAEAQAWAPNWPPGPPSPTASPRPCCTRSGHGHRPGHRGRGPGPGAVHADAGLPPRLRRLRRKQRPVFQGN
jgi:DNA-binding MarR family transcriptional regulator